MIAYTLTDILARIVHDGDHSSALGGPTVESYLPHLDEIYRVFERAPHHYLNSWWATFTVASLASIAALTAALVMAGLSIRFPVLEVVLAPVLAISQSFPLQAVAPVIIIVFGPEFLSKFLVAWLICLFPMYGSTTAALKTTPPNLAARLRVTESSFWPSIVLVRIPAALPAIIAAIQVGFTLAVLGAVVAEFMIPQAGLGSIILVGQSDFNLSTIYLCVLMLIVQGLAVYGILNVVGRHVRVRRQTRRSL